MPELTRAQNDAATYRALDACVVAGPGSGKTTVLVERYRSLIEEHRFSTDAILAITFTEKAAANMKAKLAEIFQNNPAVRRELESAWVSTIHGFCAQLLRQHAVAAGVDPRFRVLDERQSDKLQRECLYAAVNHMAETRREDTLELIERLQTPFVIGPLQDAYDAIRSAGMSIDEVRIKPSPVPAITLQQVINELNAALARWSVQGTPAQRAQYAKLLFWISTAPIGNETFQELWQWTADCPMSLGAVPTDYREGLKNVRDCLLKEQLVPSALDRDRAPYRAMIFDVLAYFDTQYRARKSDLGGLDFNDLERHTVQLLRDNQPVRERLNQQFRQIMLDEFQDINDQQWQLLELLRGPDTFFAVGDINQSIYGFRHARPGIFDAYQQATRNKHYVELLENFRSRQQILSCVQTLLHNKAGIQARSLHAGKSFAPKFGASVDVIKAIANDKDGASALEAQWIAGRLLELKRERNWCDFAVLVRTGEAMRPILESFDDSGIPYVSSRQDSFLLSREGHDITALLQTIANPLAEIHLMTVLRSPLVGLSDEALLRLRLVWSLAEGVRKQEKANLDADDAQKLARFTSDLSRWRQQQFTLPLDLLLVRVFADCGFAWEPESPNGGNIERYLHLARTTGEGLSLPQFLEEVESLSDAVDKEADLSDDDQGDRVQVLTVHAAKGLEFPVVFVAAMDKEGRNNTGAINFTPQTGLGVRWRSPDNNDHGIKDGWHQANGEAMKDREKQESNRLLYVAMTRAEEHLVLSYAAAERSPKEWAAIVDSHYGLKDLPPADRPEIKVARDLEGTEYSVSILITAQPPRSPDKSARELDNPHVPVLPRPELHGQADSVITATALAVFGQCPRKYFLQRFAGARGGRHLSWDPDAVPEAADHELDESSAAEIGTATHQLLAAIPGQYPLEVQRLAAVFHQSQLGRRAAAANPQREWEFIASVESVLVRGVIDLWFTEGDDTIIVDYKTDDVGRAELAERAALYAPQLALYAMALKKPRVRAYLHFLKPGVEFEVVLNEKAFEDARRLIRTLIQAQETLDFPLREGGHCRRCPYWKGRPCLAGLPLKASAESAPAGSLVLD